MLHTNCQEYKIEIFRRDFTSVEVSMQLFKINSSEYCFNSSEDCNPVRVNVISERAL